MKLFLWLIVSSAYGAALQQPVEELQEYYRHAASSLTDIQGHMETLRNLARECSIITEIGLRSMTSSWALLQGLADNPSLERSYLGIDIVRPLHGTVKKMSLLAHSLGIRFEVQKANDLHISFKPCELLFIDSLHTYAHLTYELETFSPQVSKYIALHDTSPPWGSADDSCYQGDYTEYPLWIDRSKRGLWPAVQDFLQRHPEWEVEQRYEHSYGLTILKRPISNL